MFFRSRRHESPRDNPRVADHCDAGTPETTLGQTQLLQEWRRSAQRVTRAWNAWLGTVEVRVMDAQSRVRDVTPLVALIQSLARLELEGEPSSVVPSPEVLAENRFLAARDGMDARLIDPAAGCLIPVREMLDSLLAKCRPHALALGCAGALDRVKRLAAANGAERQRKFIALNPRLDELVASLAHQFLAPDWRTSIAGEERGPIR